MDVRRGRKSAANWSGRDVKRFLAGAREGGRLLGGDTVQLHTPESPGVHEAEFFP